MGMTIKQEKYCEDCGKFFEYEDYDTPDDTEVCPVDSEHTTRDHSIIGEVEYGEIFFLPNHNDTYGNFATRSITANLEDYFTMCVPAGFGELISCDMICISEGTINDVDIDIDSAYGAIGEAKDNHTESDTSSTYSFVADDLSELDLSGILSGIEAGDFAGIHIDHNAIGATIHYIAIRLKYKKAYCYY